jgi:hypothetical protein
MCLPGLAIRGLAAAQPYKHGIAQTERGASFRATMTVRICAYKTTQVLPHLPCLMSKRRLASMHTRRHGAVCSVLSTC